MTRTGKRIETWVSLLALVVAAFLLGRLTERPAVALRWGPGGTVEVYHHGRLGSEWEPRDGVVYDVLAATLQDPGVDYHGDEVKP